MLADLRPGRLIEPISGRSVSGREMIEMCARRSACYADLGLRRFDRVFLHHGNSIDFFGGHRFELVTGDNDAAFLAAGDDG